IPTPAPPAMRAVRPGGWGRRTTSRTPRSSSPPTVPRTSTASAFPSTAGSLPASHEIAFRQTEQGSPPMSTFTTTDGCTIDYRVDGPADAADTLVLLHGWSQSRAMFDRALPALSTTYQVITYDQRGHGESGKPDRGARIARLAADLHELLDHLGVATAHMAGHSMGASVLWSYIDTHGTSRLDSRIVVDQPSACVVLPWLTA